MEDTSFISIKKLTKKYGENLVLGGIDLELPKGSFCTIVGPSGCGKSTLLRLILGWEAPTSGDIIVDKRLVGFPCRERGVVFQKYSLFNHLSVLQNVTLGEKFQKGEIWSFLHRKGLEEKAMSFLKEVNLGDQADKYPYELSGGMQQRVSIAQSLFMNPELLLMDEPLGALDAETRERVQMFLLRLWEKHNMTILFVTHDLEEAIFLGSRVIVLSQYWDDDEDNCDAHGAKIVLDSKLSSQAYSTGVKGTSAFRDLVSELRYYFTPDHKEHVERYNMRRTAKL